MVLFVFFLPVLLLYLFGLLHLQDFLYLFLSKLLLFTLNFDYLVLIFFIVVAELLPLILQSLLVGVVLDHVVVFFDVLFAAFNV